jgi:putative membrane protein insertion efficiency factor
VNYSIAQSLAFAILKAYKAMISPWLAPACRFTPTCSEYAQDAIERYGAVRGIGRSVKRLLRCHPFHKGGWDPA